MDYPKSVYSCHSAGEINTVFSFITQDIHSGYRPSLSRSLLVLLFTYQDWTARWFRCYRRTIPLTCLCSYDIEVSMYMHDSTLINLQCFTYMNDSKHPCSPLSQDANAIAQLVAKWSKLICLFSALATAVVQCNYLHSKIYPWKT